MSEKFRMVMRAVDDEFLEEAMMPVERKKQMRWISIAAACLILAMGLTMFPNRTHQVTIAQLSDMGYDMKLPENAQKIQYEIVTLAELEGAQASFVIQDTQYVYQEVKTQEPLQLSNRPEEEGQVLSWNVGDLDIQLLSSSSSTSVSWYLQQDQTQCYLTANADSMKVLTTAGQILCATGLNVMVAPNHAENLTYNAFLLNGLTVAETTFQIDGITYVYRMAGTLELLEDFSDISGIEESFANSETAEVLWCSAKLSYNDGGMGKVVWFDLAPGILYSLSMDSSASEEALLDMAADLFEPAQANS